jgi:hypothetical protein
VYCKYINGLLYDSVCLKGCRVNELLYFFLPVGQNASDLARVDKDLKERKRERERARFTSMSKERRNELNKKRRELYQRKKGDATLINIVICNNDYGFSS